MFVSFRDSIRLFERDLGKGKAGFGFSVQKERGLVFVVLIFDVGLSEKKVAPSLVAATTVFSDGTWSVMETFTCRALEL